MFASFKSPEGDNSRDHIYTVAVTFWAFLSQVLDPDGSCLRAVCRLKSLLCSQRQELPEEDTAAYCRARARLPIRLLIRSSQQLAQRLCASSLSRGPGRVVVMDGTGITLPDTQANREAYAYGPNQYMTRPRYQMKKHRTAPSTKSGKRQPLKSVPFKTGCLKDSGATNPGEKYGSISWCSKHRSESKALNHGAHHPNSY